MILEQRSHWFGSRKLQLTDAEVLVETRFQGNARSSRERLSLIDPHPSRERQSMKGWIAPTLIYGTLMVGAFSFGIVTIVAEAYPTSFSTGLMLCFVGLCFMTVWGAKLFGAWRRRYDIVTYFHKVTGQAVVTLLFNNPSSQAFGDFQAELESRLTSGLPGDDGSGWIASELEGLAKLRDKGVLSPEEFQAAKQSLLAKIKTERSIGFH